MDYQSELKKAREKLLLTQVEMAEKLGVSYTTVCRWETGVHEPSMKQKRKIAEFFEKNNIKVEEK